MLKEASEAGLPAPASLNGHLSTQEETGWTRRRRSFEDTLRPPKQSAEGDMPSRITIDSAHLVPIPRSATPDSTTRSSRDSRHRSSTLKLDPSPAKPITAKDDLTVSAHGSSRLQPTSTGAQTLEPTARASRLIVSSLLDQLTEIHDQHEKDRTEEWDIFLRKRNKTRKPEDIGLVGVNEMVDGTEERKAFARLIRGGIPLAYRSDVWAGMLTRLPLDVQLMTRMFRSDRSHGPWGV